MIDAMFWQWMFVVIGLGCNIVGRRWLMMYVDL
jgi:hypothetical protein